MNKPPNPDDFDDLEEDLADFTPEERKAWDAKMAEANRLHEAIEGQGGAKGKGGASKRPPPPVGADGLPLHSDESLALAFAERHGADLRFVALWNKWLLWDGSRWKIDDMIVAFDRARALCREVAKKGIRELAASTASSKKVAAVANLARSDRRHAASAEQWDAKLKLLSMPGRTIDLDTGRDRPPDPLDYSTKMTNVAVAPEGTPCPLWMAFLHRVMGGDEELVSFLQRFAGYCLSGLVTEHALLFLFGTGNNGKSVFTGILTWIFGDYAIATPMEIFIASKFDRHPTEVARLRGARLATAHETQKGRRWDESKLKALTGGDPIPARFMRGDFFDFQPTHKFIIAGNHKPGFSTVDEAIRRRLFLIPFLITIPEEERDPGLMEKLKAEGPAILRWMCDGYLQWLADGLMVPASVRVATDDYFANQDNLAQWADECVEKAEPRDADAFFEKSRDLFKSWKGWCDDRNVAAGTETVFVDGLKERLRYEQKHTNKARGFKGVRLKLDGDPPAEEGPPTELDLGPKYEPWEER
jgi:putative DNA primase/helicase